MRSLSFLLFCILFAFALTAPTNQPQTNRPSTVAIK